MIARWLAEFEQALRVHGRRRRRVLEEVSGHLHECAAGHGEAEAVRRMGDPGAVARSFTPRPFDRAFEQRDRLAALVMLAAMAASVPLAWTLQRLGREGDSHAWIWFFAFLAPTVAVALLSCLLVLRRHALGARLALPLAVMVAVTAAVVVLDLPPAQAEFQQYQLTEIGLTGNADCAHTFGCPPSTVADSLSWCDRNANCVANDHAWEIRMYYSFGALALAAMYLWAVSGWSPRRQRRLLTAE